MEKIIWNEMEWNTFCTHQQASSSRTPFKSATFVVNI